MDQAVHAYVASYLDGRDVLLMAADWARCRELSARIREDLIHLGLVDATRAVRIAEGGEASAGDLIICRRNDRSRDLQNGTRGSLIRIDTSSRCAVMRADDGRVLDLPASYLDDGHLQHAYAVTTHLAQGSTVDAALASRHEASSPLRLRTRAKVGMKAEASVAPAITWKSRSGMRLPM